MFADQFQRNGVVLDQLHRFGMATLLLSVGEEQRALLPTLKTLQQTRRGDGRIKRRPIRAGTSICALAGPSPPLAPRSTLPIPTCTSRRSGRGTVIDPGIASAARSLTKPGFSELRHVRGPVPAQRRQTISAT